MVPAWHLVRGEELMRDAGGDVDTVLAECPGSSAASRTVWSRRMRQELPGLAPPLLVREPAVVRVLVRPVAVGAPICVLRRYIDHKDRPA